MKKRIIGLISFIIFAFLIANIPSPKKSSNVNQGVLSTENQDKTEKISPSPILSDSPSRTFISSKNLESATVIKVVDGDTITVSLNGINETIRIIGINTPETVDPRKTVECFGIEASNKAKEFFKSKNYQVFLERDGGQGERDKYQRLLRYVFTDNGTVDYGLSMIAEGYAYEYTYITPYKYQAEYKKAQAEAENKRLGLWADNACSGKSTSQVGSLPISQVKGSKNIEGDRDCSDFKTQKDAQDFFVSQGGPTSDPHKLDADKDGTVCESLP